MKLHGGIAVVVAIGFNLIHCTLSLHRVRRVGEHLAVLRGPPVLHQPLSMWVLRRKRTRWLVGEVTTRGPSLNVMYYIMMIRLPFSLDGWISVYLRNPSVKTERELKY
jgi:hypothetical protein